GRLLACGSHDDTVELRSATTSKLIHVFQAQGQIPYRLFFSPGGETLIVAGMGKRIHAWSVDSGGELYHVVGNGSFHFCVAVSPDGRNLAGQGTDGQVYVWEVTTGKERTRFQCKQEVYALAFSPDGEGLIGSLGSGALCLWDLTTGQVI